MSLTTLLVESNKDLSSSCMSEPETERTTVVAPLMMVVAAHSRTNGQQTSQALPGNRCDSGTGGGSLPLPPMKLMMIMWPLCSCCEGGQRETCRREPARRRKETPQVDMTTMVVAPSLAAVRTCSCTTRHQTGQVVSGSCLLWWCSWVYDFNKILRRNGRLMLFLWYHTVSSWLKYWESNTVADLFT